MKHSSHFSALFLAAEIWHGNFSVNFATLYAAILRHSILAFDEGDEEKNKEKKIIV